MAICLNRRRCRRRVAVGPHVRLAVSVAFPHGALSRLRRCAGYHRRPQLLRLLAAGQGGEVRRGRGQVRRARGWESWVDFWNAHNVRFFKSHRSYFSD